MAFTTTAPSCWLPTVFTRVVRGKSSDLLRRSQIRPPQILVASPTLVVALGEIGAKMDAPRLLAAQGGQGNGVAGHHHVLESPAGGVAEGGPQEVGRPFLDLS